jgi:hypothetical protein
MIPAPTRLSVVLADFQLRFPKLGDIDLLQKIDARILQELMSDNEALPLTKQRLDGAINFIEAIDIRMGTHGHSDFLKNERNTKAKAYFRDASTTIEEARENLPTLEEVRGGIWKSLTR